MYSNRRAAAFFVALTSLLSPAICFAGTTEDRIREYFWDLPVMAAIAQCESEFTQYNASGATLQGGYKGRMIGAYQIAPLHLPDAQALGLDVMTLEGNMAFARHLYEVSGTRPWDASKWCWQKLPEASAVVPHDVKLAMIQKQLDAIKAALDKLTAADTGSTAGHLSSR
ncbi:hypothetical protein C4568_03895 [Candidatus Parcubacteria bacterium]|nr:MAG: hypothetical protein C4568_03895 [Candidatus Parcubacteria bacterium]